MLSDEWFADYLRRAQTTFYKRTAVMRDALPRHADRKLAAEREYDAETVDLLRRIHNGSRQPVPGVTVPVEVRRVG